MKILIYGNFSVPYTTETHHAISLEALGHTVIKAQENTITTDQIMSEGLRSQMFIWIHSHGVQHRSNTGLSMKKVLYRLKQANIPTVTYHLDLFMNIERWDKYKESSYINNIQHFFTADKNMADWLNVNTSTKGHYLPAGIVHTECYRKNLPKKYDVIFVGSKNYHKEWSYRHKLINWLQDTYKDKFTHFGNDGKRTVRGNELNCLYAESKVVVGDTLCPNFVYSNYFSDRLFETVGRGGFIIFPHIDGIRDLFKQDELVTYQFNNFIDLKHKIDYFLNNESERETYIESGFQHALKDHTYKKRWGDIINIISK